MAYCLVEVFSNHFFGHHPNTSATEQTSLKANNFNKLNYIAFLVLIFLETRGILLRMSLKALFISMHTFRGIVLVSFHDFLLIQKNKKFSKYGDFNYFLTISSLKQSLKNF
jgi:hypothetical protein